MPASTVSRPAHVSDAALDLGDAVSIWEVSPKLTPVCASGLRKYPVRANKKAQFARKNRSIHITESSSDRDGNIIRSKLRTLFASNLLRQTKVTLRFRGREWRTRSRPHARLVRKDLADYGSVEQSEMAGGK